MALDGLCSVEAPLTCKPGDEPGESRADPSTTSQGEIKAGPGSGAGEMCGIEGCRIRRPGGVV